MASNCYVIYMHCCIGDDELQSAVGQLNVWKLKLPTGVRDE